jgi:hypothetical protein
VFKLREVAVAPVRLALAITEAAVPTEFATTLVVPDMIPSHLSFRIKQPSPNATIHP